MTDSRPPLQDSDLITVDRRTLKNLEDAIAYCYDFLNGIRVNEIFIQAAIAYLDKEHEAKAEKTYTAEKIATILRPWTDVVPELTEELASELEEIGQTIRSISSLETQ